MRILATCFSNGLVGGVDGVRYTKDEAEYRNGFANLFAGNVGGPRTPLASTAPCATPAGTCAYNPAARYNIDGESDAVTGRLALVAVTDAKQETRRWLNNPVEHSNRRSGDASEPCRGFVR